MRSRTDAPAPAAWQERSAPRFAGTGSGGRPATISRPRAPRARRRGLGRPSVADGDPPRGDRARGSRRASRRRRSSRAPTRAPRAARRRPRRWRCRGCRSARRRGSTRGSLTSARAIATRCCSPPESCDGRWVARSARPTSSSRASERARASSSSTPAGAIAACTLSTRGERRDQVELLEHEAERPQPEIGEGGVAERAEVLALEAHGPLARRGRARRAAGAASSCPSRSGPTSATSSPAPMSRSTPSSARTVVGAAPEEPRCATHLVERLGRHHSTCLSASAGRMRAARQPPAAPATRPPRIATRRPSRRTVRRPAR